MGTNFYLDDDLTHVGKRLAAGWYCWDCGLTLCKEGEAAVHKSSLEGWLEACPRCGKKPIEESLGESSVGRELGFNHSRPQPKEGVKSCSSFTWAMPRQELTGQLVMDEYGMYYTPEEFRCILDECPIQFEDMVGQEFS